MKRRLLFMAVVASAIVASLWHCPGPLLKSGVVIKLPLDGTPFRGVPLPNLTFHCSVVPAAVYANGVPFTG